jgi:hypothetical protein
VKNFVERHVPKMPLERSLFHLLKRDWPLFRDEADVTAGLPVCFSLASLVMTTLKLSQMKGLTLP